ncbi:hypothetical protein [Streptacidiphilus sp. EB103A]|uniref:hypothetical protein n=1 Tax=Streptacidiphilus sp. EB103A TaxID=3156275 RepID=UPI00351357F8
MILSIGLAADPTFVRGLRALAHAGIPFNVVDLPTLAMSGDVDIPLDNLRETRIRAGEDATELSFHDVSAVWCRLLNVSDAAPDERLAHRADGQVQALCRLLGAIDLPVLNPPLREAANFSKVLHAVSLAPACGWRTPRSCLTNDPTTAQAFIRSCSQGAIFKGASAAKTWATLFEGEHEPRLPRLVHTPALFQERIVGPDVRVHVVGDRAFGEVIHSPQLDYRAARGANRFAALTLPADVLHGCRRLVAESRLPFLGVDFKIQESTGEWFFLEANPMPCYEGYDIRADGAISKAIVEWLTTSRATVFP